MTWKDKLEIGLKDDAPFRRDNLPDFQKRPGGPDTKPGDATRSPEEPGARQQAAVANRRDMAVAKRKSVAKRTVRKPRTTTARRRAARG